MPISSVLETAEAALLAVLQAQAAVPGNPLAGVPLRIGDPGAHLLREYIWLPEEVETEQRWETTGVGAQARREEFDLPVLVFIEQLGDDFDAVRSRAQALAEEVEKAVRANPTLNGSVWDSWTKRIEHSTGATETTRVDLATVTIFCRAFLS